MITIKCIICHDKIEKPRVDQLCCDKKKCKDEFNANMTDLWKIENPDKVREMNKKSYSIRKNKKPKGL